MRPTWPPIEGRTAARHDTDAADTGPLIDVTADAMVPPALIAAQERLAHGRPAGETLVAVYSSDDPAGFGPALQIVTDQATMLMDSVTVLLHRLGVAYVALMNPVFRVRRSPSGELLDVQPQSAEQADGSPTASTSPGFTCSCRGR